MTSTAINSAPQISGLFCRSHNANTWEIPYTSQSTAPGNLTQDRAQAQTIAAHMVRARITPRRHQPARCGLIMTEPMKNLSQCNTSSSVFNVKDASFAVTNTD